MTPSEIEALLAENARLKERVQQLEARAVTGLAESDRWTLRFLEGIPLGLVRVSIEGAVTFANSEAQRILGLAYNDLEQRYVTDFQGATYKDDGSPCPVEEYPVSRCLMTGEPQPAMIIGVQQPDDSISWAIFTAIPTFPDEDAPAHDGAIVAFVDISEMQRGRLHQRKLQRQLHNVQRLEALGKLAGGIAHDMNNILAVISGMAFYLSENDAIPDPDTKALGAILRSCERGRDLIRNLLGFARKGSHQLQPVALGDLVEEVCAILWRTLPENVTLEHSLAPDLPAVIGDPSQLSNALLNLCINAADAFDETSAERRITIETHLSEADDVVLTVRDTGVGIEEAHLQQVFEPFFTTKPLGQGTGLGLSMVYGTIKQAGGDIRVTSTLGEGTAVRVSLPAAHEHALPPQQAATSPTADGSCLRILVVEDEPDVLLSVAQLLEVLGHEPTAAPDGTNAIALLELEAERFDLILLDIRLPDISPELILARVEQIRPGLSVILTTGHAEDALLRRLSAQGYPILAKPMDIDALRTQIARVAHLLP